MIERFCSNEEKDAREGITLNATWFDSDEDAFVTIDFHIGESY
jgi:hypothetical protein